MKRADYFLDFQKLEEFTNSSFWFDEKDKANFKYEFLKQTYLNKPAKKYKHPVMLYLGNKKFSIKYELEDILEMIKNGATKAETEYYRKHFTESESNKQKQQFLNSLKSFTPCGIFYNRKSRVEIRKLNGIVMLENHGEGFSSNQIKKIKENSLTFAIFRKLDTDKIIILIKTYGMNAKNYKAYEKFIQELFNKILNTSDIHFACMNNIIYLSYDSELYLNPNSVIIKCIL